MAVHRGDGRADALINISIVLELALELCSALTQILFLSTSMSPKKEFLKGSHALSALSVLQVLKERLCSPKIARFPTPGSASREGAETPCEDKSDISAC